MKLQLTFMICMILSLFLFVLSHHSVVWMFISFFTFLISTFMFVKLGEDDEDD